MFKTILNVCLTVVFSLVLAFIILIPFMLVVFNADYPLAILTIPSLIIFFGHPCILFTSFLLSKKLLRIRARGKMLYLLGIPIQYGIFIIFSFIAYILYTLLPFTRGTLVPLMGYTAPLISLAALFSIDRFRPIRNENLPGHYEGE